MAEKIVKAAQRELEKLEAVLADIPEFRRWQALKGLVDTYQETGIDETPIKSDTGGPQIRRSLAASPPTQPAVKPPSKSEPVVRAAREYLRAQGKRVTSTVMAQTLIEQGVQIPGKNAAATLSAYLSATKDIDNVRGEGYGLIEWDQAPPGSRDPELSEDDRPEPVDHESEAPDSELSGAPNPNGGYPQMN